MVNAATKLRPLLLGRKAMTNLDSILKKQRHYFASKGPSSQSYGFSSSRVWIWELDYKESWAQKNWCFWTVVVEKMLKSPLDCKEIQPVHPKRNQSWIFIGRTDVEAETPIPWPPDARKWLIWKDPDAGKTESRRRRGWQRMMRCWMALPTRWTWVWVKSRSWQLTGWSGVLQSVGPQSRIWLSDWTELNWYALLFQSNTIHNSQDMEITYVSINMSR